MKKKLLFLATILCYCYSFLFINPILAQSPHKKTIKGIVQDTSKAPLPQAVVMLLSAVDSTLLTYTTTNDEGHFEIKGVKNTKLVLKTSYLSFIPYQQTLEVSETEVQDIGEIRLKPITNDLLDVVIKAAKAPLYIRGDTIEYDATTFKVPPGSTVEDLLRRLPGIDVDADGNIKAQGKDVKRLYVDGKTFFSNDPKAATKNLGAETISRVQVFDEKSEQAKLTGVEDGKKEKVMNLELKDEFKKGAFGKLTLAGGTSERWASRGNYNKFDEKNQLSFIGYGNNINQTGVNWEDYGEFKGQNTFNDQDNGDFGFSSGGGMFYYSNNDDGGLRNYFDGRGFTRNFGGGINYNLDNTAEMKKKSSKKFTKLNASYTYNETALTLSQFQFQQNFLNSRSFYNQDSLRQSNFRGNHNIATRWEQNLDSLNILIVKADARFSHSNNKSQNLSEYYRTENVLNNALNLNNNTILDARRISSTGIFRHRFAKKKGRSFALSAAFNGVRDDGNDNLNSLNNFFAATTFTEQVRRLNERNNNTDELKSSMLFVEPLSKKWFSEYFYNFKRSQSSINNQLYNTLENNKRINDLSVFYDNQQLFNRFGTSIRYSNDGLNVVTGLAAQQLKLDGQYAIDPNSPFIGTPIKRNFDNLIPYFSANYEPINNMYVSADYTYKVDAPNFSDLQPVRNVSNPLMQRDGNPNLGTERSHEMGVSLNYWNSASMSHFGLATNHSRYESQIVYNQIIQFKDSLGVFTLTKPENMSGGRDFNTYMWSGFPLIKTKLTASINGNLQFRKSPTLINDVLNTTDRKNYNLRFGLNATPNKKLILGATAGINFTDISYSIQSTQNQKIRNQSLNASAKWQFASKSFLETNFDYNVYKNDRFGFNQTIPIWNASIRQILGKNNKLEMRLAAFDLLNKKVSISQYGSSNYVSRTVANTLARYFMLSLSYNVKGYENKLSKNNWW